MAPETPAPQRQISACCGCNRPTDLPTYAEDNNQLHDVTYTLGLTQAVASGLCLPDIVAVAKICRSFWRSRRRWRVALAASRDVLWASLALDDCRYGHMGCVSFGGSHTSVASEEALRCFEQCELEGGRPSLLRAIELPPLHCFRTRTPTNCKSPSSRLRALVSLIRRAAQRQPWRLLEVGDDLPVDKSHPVLALLRSPFCRKINGAVEEALVLLTDPELLKKAAAHREHMLVNGPAACSHRATCAHNCGRTEAYQGQFGSCPLCKETVYCSEQCRIAHWTAGHRLGCRGAVAHAIATSAAPAQAAFGDEGVGVAGGAPADGNALEESGNPDDGESLEDAPIAQASPLPPLLPPPPPDELASAAGTSGLQCCPECARERRELLEPYAGVVNRVLGNAWGDWHALGVWPRQPPAVLALAAAASELLAAAAGEPRQHGRPRCILEAWAEFRQRAARDAQALVVRLRSFVDAIAASTVPAWVFRHAEARARQELGPDKDAWPSAARRVAPVGARAVEALAGWLAAVLRAAAIAPPLPPRARLRTVESYKSPDPEALVVALCQHREVSEEFVGVLGHLTSFVSIPPSLLFRHLNLGADVDAARLLLTQPWIPSSGLDSSLLQQVCAVPNMNADLVKDLAARTIPDGFGLRALWSRAGAPGELGEAVRDSLEAWTEMLDGDEVAAAVLDTPLDIPELSADEVDAEESPDLDALALALTSTWLEGLPLHIDTAKSVYSRRPLTAASVRVLQVALSGLEPAAAEAILAEVERPCLAWHDSCGVVALLEWLGYGPPLGVVGSFVQGGGGGGGGAVGRTGNRADVGVGRPLLARLLHGFLQTEQPKGDTSLVPRRHPRDHSRASVEAVECLLSASPKLARSLLPLEQLGPASLAIAMAAEGPTVVSNNADGSCTRGISGTGLDLLAHVAGAGRLLPLQTLCVCCGDAPNVYTASLARALLRRSPEASNQPLPRALRRNARGRHYDVFVCTAASALQLRCLAAEEATLLDAKSKHSDGDDTAAQAESLEALLKLREALLFQAQPAVAGMSSAVCAPSPPHGPPPGVAAPSPPAATVDTRRRGSHPVSARGAPSPQAPSSCPPMRRSPRQLNSSLVLPQAPVSARAPRGVALAALHTQRPTAIRRQLPAIRAQ